MTKKNPRTKALPEGTPKGIDTLAEIAVNITRESAEWCLAHGLTREARLFSRQADSIEKFASNPTTGSRKEGSKR